MPQLGPLIPAAELVLSPNTTPQSQKMQEDVPRGTTPVVAPAEAPAAEPVKVEEPKDDKFLASVKKEKELLRQKRELAKQRQMIDAQLSEAKKWDEAKALAQTSKLQAIQKLGFTYDELTNEALNQQAPTPEQIASRIVEEKLAAFNEQLAKQQQALQEQQYNQALQHIASEAKILVTSSPDFPLVKDIAGYDTIMRRIESEFQKSGRIMPVEEAAKEYEAFLEEEISALGSRHEKLRSKILPKEEPKQESETAHQQKPQTLTHKQTVSPPASKPMTYAERRKRAEDVFYGRTV